MWLIWPLCARRGDIALSLHLRSVVILGSDGLWDGITPDRAVELVTKHTAEGGTNPAQVIVDHALYEHTLRMTSDNVTAVVVFVSGLSAHSRFEAK